MLENGQKFAHFVIERKLGEGGMGAVYLAEDQKLHRKVALKILTGDVFDDANRLERFYREAKVVAQVSNAYVMSLFDIGKATDEKSGQEVDYLVMEYTDGPSLADYIKDERPELPKVIRLAEKIATGLAAAHKLGIVHRDIKPDNILVDESGDPKILDFGLAKPIDPMQFGKKGDSTDTMSQELTKVGKIMGTVSYMSPEQVRGEAVDTRSDIFSFGILLYRMVTGDLPFAGPTQVETMAKILESNFDPPSVKNDAIPPELERIIVKCLQKDPDERYQGSRDLVVDLRNLRRQFDSGLTDSVSGITRPIQKASSEPRRRKRRVIATSMVLIIVVVGFFGVRWWGDEEASAPSGLQAKTNSLAILGFENKTGDEDLDWLQTGLPEILLTDLSHNQNVQIIGRQRILDCMSVEKKNSHTVEECIEAATTLGATRVLSGTFFKLGDKIRIDARIQ
ncbi:MAG: protein kinase, partial [Proteobacteria bacterium]|nr:protein kinase [Pseudomonadota bacterium]